ncbi:MAG: ABC transporter ATP-binding protein [Cognatishimia sp.]
MKDASPKDAVLEVHDLEKSFGVKGGFLKRAGNPVKALRGISFELGFGETLGLVGESGCGKTTLGRCVLRAIEPSNGTIEFASSKGKVDLRTLDAGSMRAIRPELQMVFQDPYGSLDPRMTIFDLVSEPLRVAGNMTRAEMQKRVAELMTIVGLNTGYLNRYPHAFSGGQRQRICIARALATNPRLIVCDEAVSALDVSVKAQILNLLSDLQKEYGIAYLFVSHDLSVVRHISHRVAVMYLGQLVELGTTDDLFSAPKHPYTEALLSAIPNTDPDAKSRRISLRGDPPDPTKTSTGCPFADRCAHAQDVCQASPPVWQEITPGHHVSCHRAHELSLVGAVN